MATLVTLYKCLDGKVFESETEADAHDSMTANKAEIDAFVAKHFPVKKDSQKGNPHAGTAAKAIALWLAEHPVATEAASSK